MLDLYAVAQMRDAEERAEIEYGIALSELMDNAGRCLAQNAAEMLHGKTRVDIFCGKGNNGGDGYVCAAALLARGFQVAVWGISRESLPQGSLAANAAATYEKLGGVIRPLTLNAKTADFDCDLIVDALLGTGLERPLSELYAHVVTVINDTGIPVLSCDLPSGVNADTGEIMGAAIRARRTLMLGLAKLACRLYPGRECFGDLRIGDIGLPHELIIQYTPILV